MEKDKKQGVEVSNKATTSKEKILTDEEKQGLNKKANALLKELTELLEGNTSKSTKLEIKRVLAELEVCAKKLKSEFLDDIVFMARKSLNFVKAIRENKNGKV